MSWSHIQNNVGNWSGSVANALSVAFPSAVASGHLIVGGGAVDNSPTVTGVTVTDDKSNTYTVNFVANVESSGVSAFNFYLGNVTNGPQTITVTTVGGDPSFTLVFGIDDFSGNAAVSNPLDVSTSNAQNNPGTGTNAITSGNATTTVNGDLIYGLTVCVNDITQTIGIAAGTGFTLSLNGDGVSSAGGPASEYLVQGSAGSTAATFTRSTTGFAFMQTFLLTFKQAVTAAIGTTLILMGVG